MISMPLPVFLLLIVGITSLTWLCLQPLQVLSRQQWLISHGVVFLGLFFILAWIWLALGDDPNVTLLMGGIWTTCGGICFVAVFVLRRLR